MSNSQGEVRTALVQFLTAATKILTLVTPQIEEEMRQRAPVKFKPTGMKRAPTVITSDDDEVPF